MAEPLDIPAWLALFIGLYALAAAVGEFRQPGSWKELLRALERGIAVRFLTGIVCLALGAAIYLVNPWRADDWLAVAVSVIGGAMVAEGLLLLAAPDRFLALARRFGERTGTIGAGLAALIGFALILAALARL